MTENKGSFLARVGAAAGLGLGLVLAAGSAAGASVDIAAATPVITVAPATGLADGAVVTVAGTGLTAGGVYHVGQCAAVLANAYACNYATAIDITANRGGSARTSLTVSSSFVGNAADGSSWTVDCKVSTCVIGVYNDAFEGGAVPLSFS